MGCGMRMWSHPIAALLVAAHKFICTVSTGRAVCKVTQGAAMNKEGSLLQMSQLSSRQQVTTEEAYILQDYVMANNAAGRGTLIDRYQSENLHQRSQSVKVLYLLHNTAGNGTQIQSQFGHA